MFPAHSEVLLRVDCRAMSRQYIYQVENLTKKHGQKVVLDDIWLAFYPGAKIGVLGPNGAGKSTLLRIMAGQDTEFDGVARLGNGFTVGYLEQEPPLDETKTVFENVQLAVAERQAILDRYNEISMLLGEVTDDDEMQKLCDEMAKLQDTIEANNLWELDRQVEMSMAPNPSHLEAVNSVVAGMVRSKQMRVDTVRAGRTRVSQRKVMGECPYASPFHTQIPNYHPITTQLLTNYRFVDTRRRRVLRVGRERRGDAAAGPA